MPVAVPILVLWIQSNVIIPRSIEKRDAPKHLSDSRHFPASLLETKAMLPSLILLTHFGDEVPIPQREFAKTKSILEFQPPRYIKIRMCESKHHLHLCKYHVVIAFVHPCSTPRFCLHQVTFNTIKLSPVILSTVNSNSQRDNQGNEVWR